MTTEEKIEKISKLEANYEAMAAEIEKLKAELTKKDKNETVWIPEIYNTYMCIDSFGYVYIVPPINLAKNHAAYLV